MQTNPLKVGLAFGIFLALCHAGWALLVASGVAQALMDFVFWIHFITPPYHVEAFTPARGAESLPTSTRQSFFLDLA